jgi:tetratricopeptide (TPR) repeat protein
MTIVAHARSGFLASVEALPLPARIANVLWSLVAYLGTVVWPTRLAVFYPLTGGRVMSGRTLAAVAILGLVSGLAVRNAARRPYLLTGWLWYLLALAPVIGLVQTGLQSRADRYMYIPFVGVGILVAWGAADLASSWKTLRPLLPWAAAATLISWTALTRAQVRHWESTVTLFSHAVEVAQESALAYTNLARALAAEGDIAGAERHYRAALRVPPDDWKARTGLGVVLMQQGHLAEALEQHRQALRLNPSSADVYFNIGAVEARMGRTAEAAARYAEAVRLNPRLAAAHYNWGNLLAAGGRWAEAEAHFAEAVRLEPEDVEAINNLGLAIGLQGRWAQAAELLARAVALDPAHPRARVNLGRALRGLGRLDEARAQWQEVVRRNPRDPAALEAQEELARP